MEAELLQTCDDLPELSICKLAGNGRRHNGINLVFRVVFALLDDVYDVKDKGLVGNSSERALIYACAAGDALVVVDAAACFSCPWRLP